MLWHIATWLLIRTLDWSWLWWWGLSILQNDGVWFRKKNLHFISSLSLLSQTYTKEKGNLKYQTENYPWLNTLAHFRSSLKGQRSTAYQSLRPKLWNWIRRQVNNVSLAEDVVHMKQCLSNVFQTTNLMFHYIFVERKKKILAQEMKQNCSSLR